MTQWSIEDMMDKDNFEVREILIKLICIMIEIGYDNDKIYDILKFGIDNLKEIREMHISLKATKEILEEQFGKE